MQQVKANDQQVISQPLTFHECCKTILHSKANEYAKAYARHGRHCSDAEEVRVQALYILNNIQHWRGEQSKEVRARLKEFSK